MPFRSVDEALRCELVVRIEISSAVSGSVRRECNVVEVAVQNLEHGSRWDAG